MRFAGILLSSIVALTVTAVLFAACASGHPKSRGTITTPSTASDANAEPVPSLPAGVDLVELSKEGEDVPSLDVHAVKGKVTLFDFYAVWCAPCRKIDAYVFALLGKRADVAVRKLNVVSWETPLAARYLKDIPSLPYVVVYGKDGKRVRAVAGLELDALDKAVAEASGR